MPSGARRAFSDRGGPAKRPRPRRWYPPQARRRPQRSNPSNSDTNNNINDEILEQLKLQRIQQEKKQAEQHQSQSLEDMTRNELSTKPPWPTEQLQRCFPLSRKRQFPFLEISSKYPSVALLDRPHAIALAACVDPRERRRLVSHWSARRLWQSFQIVPSAFEARGGHFIGLFSPVLSVSNAGDLYGLMHTPPHARTFDVWPGKLNQSPKILTTESTGLSLRNAGHYSRTALHNRVISLRFRALPCDLDQSTQYICAVTECRPEYNHISTGHRMPWVVLENRTDNPWGLVGDFADFCIGWSAENMPVNDLCFLSPNRILLARQYRRNKSPRLPVFTVGYGMERYTGTNLAPTSDAFCIEPDYKEGLACTGFRNGQILVSDLDGNDLAVSKCSESFGSIHSLLSLGSKQMLARGSFGSCCLFDLRKLPSSGKDQISAGCAVVNHFQLPDDAETYRLSRKCRGIATDPCQSTLFSPIVDGDEIPALAGWSLHTGEFLGVKRLASDDGEIPSSSSKAVSWVELCPRATTTWSPAYSSMVSRKKDSFSLFYKTGMSPAGSSLPEWAGNIHQVTFDGRPSLFNI